MYTFKPASPYTQHCFNPYGLKPYDAVLECEIREEPTYASYDLTVIDFNDHYKVAHGSFIEPFIFKTLDEAKKWLITWYEANKQRKAARI
jgi:hypothetical protein